jgi:hypothetical protein
VRSKPSLPLVVPFAALAGAVGFGAWTGYPVHSDAVLTLLERERGKAVLAKYHPDRPLYGWMLQLTENVTGTGRAVQVGIALAAWAVLAWLTSLLWKRLFPGEERWSWLPALLLFSPIVVQVQFVGLTIAYPGVLPVSLALGALLLDLPPREVRRPARAAAALLLAGLAAVISEYGVAAAFGAAALALVMRHRRTALLLALGAGAGAILFRLTSDASARPDVSIATQLPNVLDHPMRAFGHWIAGFWYALAGAYGEAVWRMKLDPDSRGTVVAFALGLLAVPFVAAAVRRFAASDTRAFDRRRALALIVALGATMLPVVLADRGVAWFGASVSSYETRFLLPALPFACVLAAAALVRVVVPNVLPVAASILALLCVQQAWQGAFDLRREQARARELGRVLQPLVRRSPGITLAVVPENPSPMSNPITTSKVTLGWPADEAARTWVSSLDKAPRLVGSRERCRVGETISIPGEIRWAGRSGPLGQVLWVPDRGDRVGQPEPYCLAAEP